MFAIAALVVSLLAATFTARQAKADRTLAWIEKERWLKENEPDIELHIISHDRKGQWITLCIKNLHEYPLRGRMEVVFPGEGTRFITKWWWINESGCYFFHQIMPFSYSREVTLSTVGVPAVDVTDFKFRIIVWTPWLVPERGSWSYLKSPVRITNDNE